MHASCSLTFLLHFCYSVEQEINPRHPIISKLNELVAADENSAEAKDLAWLLFDTALASSGFAIEAVEDYSARVYR